MVIWLHCRRLRPCPHRLSVSRMVPGVATFPLPNTSLCELRPRSRIVTYTLCGDRKSHDESKIDDVEACTLSIHNYGVLSLLPGVEDKIPPNLPSISQKRAGNSDKRIQKGGVSSTRDSPTHTLYKRRARPEREPARRKESVTLTFLFRAQRTVPSGPAFPDVSRGPPLAPRREHQRLL